MVERATIAIPILFVFQKETPLSILGKRPNMLWRPLRIATRLSENKEQVAFDKVPVKENF